MHRLAMPKKQPSKAAQLVGDWRHVDSDESPSGEQVRAARLHYDLTQTEAGALIGYTLNGWQRFEQSERTMRPALWEQWQRKAKELRARMRR